MLQSNSYSFILKSKNSVAAAVIAVLASNFLGCSKSADTIYIDRPSAPVAPLVQGPVAIEPGKPVTLDNGAQIQIYEIENKAYFEVEATFAPGGFDRMVSLWKQQNPQVSHAEVAQRTDREIQLVLNTLKTKAKIVGLKSNGRFGYFTFLMEYPQDGNLFEVSRGLTLPHLVYLNPVVNHTNALAEAKAYKPQNLDLPVGNLSQAGRTSFRDYSGLTRVRAPEFAALVEAEIGGTVKVDGSNVNLGITDTGITYNHPTFLAADKKTNRIIYMKDYTREGRVYFAKNATMTVEAVSESSSEIVIKKAQTLETPKLPRFPYGDRLKEVENVRLQVSPELKALLLDPANGVKLGYLLEEVMSADGELADINGNGKAIDRIPVLFVMGPDNVSPVVYADFSGQGDLRAAKKIRDFNSSQDVVPVLAEKVGFQIDLNDKLPASGGGEVEVISASLVGYDPGNHGSHVAGIAAGRKTISNDRDDTLARGVAPAAQIMMNRVCANNTGCNATAAFVDLASSGAEVINMSLGGLSPFNDGFGVEETLINRIVLSGNTAFMISAGNSGPGHQTVGSPSVARLSLSVGASANRGMIERQYLWTGGGSTNDELESDFMLFFSSRGPTSAGGFKPNITAPGTELSAIQLNAAPGAHAGLDVYWGTSMSAPTATGAYALFLDGVKKYNAAHPESALASDSVTLRNIILQSARPIDMNSYNPETGESTEGQYTWIDQGKGMVDLVAAWKLLKKVRDEAVPATFEHDGAPYSLDYITFVETDKNPSGNKYNGSEAREGEALFGQGLYLDYLGTESLKKVHVGRRLLDADAESAHAGDLIQQLVTSADEFVLKTTIYGSKKNWVRAGVLDAVDCHEAPSANLVVIGQGAALEPKTGNTAKLSGLQYSTLNVCIDRRMVREELTPGDHGALIDAFRVVDGKVSHTPAFTVPVYVTVPEKVMADNVGVDTQGLVKSFGVGRHYVNVPEGTTVMRVTLEVPAVKTDRNGLVDRSQDHCSGVELMPLLGLNTDKPFQSRAEARIANCDKEGAPIRDDAKRKVVVTRSAPRAGVWDLHVFGSYNFPKSKYNIKVDYITATPSVERITGVGAAVLNGSLTWTVQSASMTVTPSQTKSVYDINGLIAVNTAQVAEGNSLFVPGPTGAVRVYGPEISTVFYTSGGSTGNDIDMEVFECPATATTPEDPACRMIGQSGGATDVETVRVAPRAGKAYAVRITGYQIHDTGRFTLTEKLMLSSEKGVLGIQLVGDKTYGVDYGFTPEKLAASRILNSTMFTSGVYSAIGNLQLKSDSDLLLASIPVKVSNTQTVRAP